MFLDLAWYGENWCHAYFKEDKDGSSAISTEL
jgi:hypothetical protein